MLENFKGKNNTNGLDANPQNINREGRPKSAIARVVDALKTEGHEPASRADIESAYVILAGLTEESLRKISEDEENPILVRTVANTLITGWKAGMYGLDKVLDRAIGKPMSGQDDPPFTIKDSNVIVVLPQNKIDSGK